MPIRHFLTGRDPPPHDSAETDGSVRGLLETGLEMANDASSCLRDTADDRVATVQDRTRGLTENVGRRIEDALIDQLESRLHGATETTGEHSEEERTEYAERRLQAFLRRYDLDKDRLNDRTLIRFRRRFVLEASQSVDELLEAATGNGPASEGSMAADEEPPSLYDVFGESFEQFCHEASVDPDKPLGDVVKALVRADAITVAHAVESVVEQQHAHEGEEQPGTGVSHLLSDLTGTVATADAPGPVLSDQDADVRGSYPDGRGDTLGPNDGMGPPFQDGVNIPAAAALVVSALSTVSTGPSDSGNGSGLSDFAVAIIGDGPDVVTVLSGLSRLTGGRSGEDKTRPTGGTALGALFVVNLVAMSIGAYLSRKHAPPIPDEVQGPNGGIIVPEAGITEGKKVFQANGLMNHGSVLGNGSYFGSDLTADALRAKTDHMRDYYAQDRGADAFEDLDEDARAAVAQQVETELDAESGSGDVVTYSDAEAYAHQRIREEYVDRYYRGRRGHGIPEGTVSSREAAERLADFACWTAWIAHTNRPGSSHSYTNDWPYVPGTGNRPTDQVLGWSTLSVVLLIAGGGIGVWAYHSLDFGTPATEAVDIPTPDAVSVTPAQYVSAWYVPVAGALFTVQVLAGALLAHYYVERSGFFGIGERLGIDMLSVLSFSTVRTWHINLAILWITALWLAGGLFLPGLFDDEDPPGQATGAAVLLCALVVTTVGAFTGVWLGIQGKLGTPEDGNLWWLLGSEGLEYLEAGRVWKLALLTALTGWTGLVLRGVRRVDETPTGLGHFMVYAGGSIALLFGASMLYTPDTNIAMTEFWRWWVVHMWVEGVFEFFVTAVTAIALVSMNLLERTAAEKAILFEVFAIMGAGIVGVSHHYWWVGLPDFWVPIGTTFSTLEFVPLMFILHQSLEEYRTLQAQGEAFPYTLPLLFIVGSSVWNFVGGGVLGFFINIPAINYFEHGTYLTVAHGHTATFGAFGLLALGLGTYILRVVTPEDAWEPSWFRGTFWLTNVGLVVMTVASLLPLGFRQLQAVYNEGYATARSPEFYERPRTQRMLWARSLGDAPMILGALAFTAGAVRQLVAARGRARRTAASR